MNLTGCDFGSEESASAPSSVVLSGSESAPESDARSSSPSSVKSSLESGSSFSQSTEIPQSTESIVSSESSVPIEEPNVFHLIRDPQNEVNIRFDGDKVTVYGKDTDLDIQWITADYGKPIDLSDSTGEFSCEQEIPLKKNEFLNLYIITSRGFSDSYRMKYDAKEKTLSFVVPMGAVQQNISVTENPPILAPSLVKRYVTTKKDGDINAILTKIRSLSDEICKGLDSDYDKLRAISRWVSDNIYYDYPAHDAGIPEECLSLEYMLDKHSSVCGGYANMTSALCAAQGIKCYNIKGHVLQGDANYDEAHGAPAYHEWNYAVIDGRVIWIDSGWNSYNYFRSSGEYDYGGIGYKYFDIGIEAFSQGHMCDSAEYRDFYGLLE